jgi:hypothetical protein
LKEVFFSTTVEQGNMGDLRKNSTIAEDTTKAQQRPRNDKEIIVNRDSALDTIS